MEPRNGKYLKIGHRGASDYAPENTLKAYELALQMEADMCEVDVHLTSDGHPVLIHDADVSRTTNGHGKVGGLTLEALRAFDAGQGECVPTLQEAIDLVGDRGGLYIELKGADVEEVVVDVIRQNGYEDRVIVGSFHPDRVRWVRQLAPEIETSCLIWLGMTDWAELCNDVGALYAHFCWEKAPEPHTLLDEALFKIARRYGIGVVIWHEERKYEIAEIIKRPIDAICSNKPDLL